MATTLDPLRYYRSPEGYEAMRAWYDGLLGKLSVPYESRRVSTRFGETHVLVLGPDDAPPLIMLQGLAGSAPLWHQQFPAFAASRRLYALDTVGQPGRSAPNAPSLLDDGYADWLIDVLDALALPQADMMGVSLGSSIILRVGALAPERIRRAVLLSPMGLARGKMNFMRWMPNPFNRRKQPGDLEDRLTARSFAAGSGQEQFDRQLARAMALATKHYRVDLALGIPAEASRLGRFAALLRVIQRLLLPLPDRELRAFQAAGMLVLGEHESLYDPQRAARRAQKLIPHLRVEIVAGAGHAAIYDAPHKVNPLILDYLTQP